MVLCDLGLQLRRITTGDRGRWLTTTRRLPASLAQRGAPRRYVGRRIALRAAGFCGRGSHRVLAHASHTQEWLRLMQRQVELVLLRALLDLFNKQAPPAHNILAATV